MKKILLNKYFYVSLGFFVWMVFFDQESLMVQYKLSSEIGKLRQQEKFYTEEIEKNKLTLDILTNDTASLEKFARETYLMKKANEDVFVVVDDKE